MEDEKTVDETEGEVAPPEDPEIEKQARSYGWKPKEEYKGPEDKWQPAKDYVERAESVVPIMRSVMRKQTAEISQMRETLDKVGEFISKTDQRAYERAMSDIQERQRQAVAEGDLKAYDAAQKDAAELQKKVEQPNAMEGDKARPPAAVAWAKRNDWFTKDRVLNAAAQALHIELQESNPELSLEENLDEVTRLVKERYPAKFGINPKREKAAAVETGRLVPRRSNGKSYDDLPAEAKRECDRFVKEIPGFKREEYLKHYDWS